MLSTSFGLQRQHCLAPSRVRPSRVQRCGAVVASTMVGAKQRELSFTALGGNSWKATFPAVKQTILVDPWLTGDLTFGPDSLSFLYVGKKGEGESERDRLSEASDATVLLLTQGLDDHAHRPTLSRLPKDLPVVASPAAAAVARSLGFRDVRSVAPGAAATVNGLRFKGTVGALVGPPWSTRENGFIVEEVLGAGADSGDGAGVGVRVYYEPHLDFDAASVGAAAAGGRAGGREGAVDVVVAPCTAVLLGGYPLVQGSADNVVRLMRLLQWPKFLVPLRNDQIVQEGVIAPLVYMEGGVPEVRERLKQQQREAGEGKATEIMEAEYYKPLTLRM